MISLPATSGISRAATVTCCNALARSLPLHSHFIGHAPKPLLAKNFGLPETAFDSFPKQEVYFARGAIPPEAQSTPLQGWKLPPQTHKYRLLEQAPHAIYQGGREWRVDASRFPISTTVTGDMSILIRAGCASCTGTPPRTSGSTSLTAGSA